MHRHRWFGLLVSLAIVLAVLPGAGPASVATAQEATSDDEASPEAQASPIASPEATAETGFSRPTFAAEQWRITIVAAVRGDTIPEAELDDRDGRDWVLIVVDVTNWSDSTATLPVRNFRLRMTGEEEPRGLSRGTTERTAELLRLEPRDAREGVRIVRERTARVVLVFSIEDEDVNPALLFEDRALPLADALATPADLLVLPPIASPPPLTPAKVKDVPDGATLELETGDAVRLAWLDPPLPEECFGGQSISRLKRLAGDEVLLEPAGNGDDYVWVEQRDGSRVLVNYELIADGFAALLPDADDPFAAWLADGEQQAKTASAGLWGACTSQHGVARPQGPERAVIRVRSGDTTQPYTVWIAWSPTLVTTPDGGAWAIFSAETQDGPDQGKKRLYTARFDPATGEWEPATPMPGGDVQFGPSAVVDARGIVHLVYSDRARDEEGIYSTLVYTHEDGAGGWTEPIAVAPDPDAGDQLAPSLTIDARGTLHVVWQDQRAFGPEARAASPVNADIFASELPPGGEWSPPVMVNRHRPTAAGSRPHVVADGDRLVAVWSVYTAAFGLASATRLEWATRQLDESSWSAPKTLITGRGERFGGRLLDLAADPNGGVILVYGRQANDTFLFARRLKPDATEWGGDVLITFGNKGTYPSLAVNRQGTAYIAYNVGIGSVVDVGAVAIPFRSIEPGPEVLLTQDDPDTQGLAAVAIDITDRPWLLYLSEVPGSPPDKVYVLRNAEIPTGRAPAPADDA